MAKNGLPMNCANCESNAGRLRFQIILHGERNQSFHGERIADAVHLHVFAVVLRIAGAGADGHDLAMVEAQPAICALGSVVEVGSVPLAVAMVMGISTAIRLML